MRALLDTPATDRTLPGRCFSTAVAWIARRPRKLIRDLPARAPLTRPPPPSPKRSPLHDAAEVGDVELILKLLSKESNDGDFNPVRLAPPSLSSDSAIVELGRPVEADEKKLRKNPHL